MITVKIETFVVLINVNIVYLVYISKSNLYTTLFSIFPTKYSVISIYTRNFPVEKFQIGFRTIVLVTGTKMTNP